METQQRGRRSHKVRVLFLAAAFAAIGCEEPLAAPDETYLQGYDGHRTVHEPPGSLCDEAREAFTERVSTGPDEAVVVERFLDLDGDQRLDCFFSTSGRCGSGGCAWDAYLLEQPPRWAGRFDGRAPTMANPTAFADVYAEAHIGCCEWIEYRYVFTDTTYALNSERACRAVPESDDSHCEEWQAPPGLGHNL